MNHRDKNDKPVSHDRMRVAFTVAAVRGRDTKHTVCMVRTVLQNRDDKPFSKERHG